MHPLLNTFTKFLQQHGNMLDGPKNIQWCPSKVSEIHLLEGNQRSLTPRINGTSHLNYSERLDFLGPYSLKKEENVISFYTYEKS